LVEYKKSTDTLYNTVGKTTGTQIEITGLTPGLQYDFRVTSINQFDLSGGVASLLTQLAPGDNTAPATPSGITANRKLGTAIFEWGQNGESDFKDYYFEVHSVPSGFGLITWGFTTQRHIEVLVNTGNLTSAWAAYIQVQARDLSGNMSPVSSRVGFSVPANSGAVLQDDVANNEIMAKATGASASGNWGAGTLVSATITTRGFPVNIEFTVGRAVNTGGLTVEAGSQLKRGSTTIESEFANAVLFSGMGASLVGHYRDTPAAGTYTYSINKNPSNAAITYSNARLIITEQRR
jgi:hypothetical protein